MREIHTTLTATDGHLLAATLYEPENAPQATVLISSATGAPRRYYKAYAQFLAAQGFVALTYDYRGIGDSCFHGAIPRQDIRMLHWGSCDLSAALEWLHQRHPRLPLLALGHSVGGQMLGLAPNNHLVTAALGIAAQSGYWGLWPLRQRLIAAACWNLVVPGAVALFGDLPGWVIGCPLPGGIAREWARWGRNRHFISDERGAPIRAHFEAYRGRMRFYSLADDHIWGPASAIEALATFYRNAEVEVRVMQPQAHGAKSIGHFGFFRSSMPRSGWQETADWLRLAALAALPTLRIAA